MKTITAVEIEGVGSFEVKHNLMHRGQNPRLKLHEKGKYRSVQFDSFKDPYNIAPEFQKGYDYEGNEIQIKIIKSPK
jgi:hypothetical protein